MLAADIALKQRALEQTLAEKEHENMILRSRCR